MTDFEEDEKRIEGRAQELLAQAREELVRADGKASIILAAAGVVFGALLAGLIAGSWTPSVLSNAVEWAWWLSIAAALAGLFALGSAVYPRTRRKVPAPEGTVAYFGDVVSHKEASLSEALAKSLSVEKPWVVDQLDQVAHIVSRKYNAIKVGLWFLLASGVLALVSVLADWVFA